MSLSLSDLQADHQIWLTHNFPGQQSHQPLLGLAEEVGELAHAHLKHEQNIRGYDDDRYRLEAADSIGDIVIYLASYCHSNGFDLQMCVDEAWRQVRERDWQADPEGGGE